MEQSNVTQIIIDTINTILGNLFSSIDNNLYNLLDDITFVDAGILHDKNFENIFGTSTSNGILLIANSLLLGIILYFAIRYLLSHFTYSKIESPHSFLIKLVICGICMNCSYFLLSQFLDIFSSLTLNTWSLKIMITEIAKEKLESAGSLRWMSKTLTLWKCIKIGRRTCVRRPGN